jgi:CubicO group peptidase (beta-lactamase class C family)
MWAGAVGSARRRLVTPVAATAAILLAAAPAAAQPPPSPDPLDAPLQAVVDGLSGDVFVGAGLDGKRQPFYVPGSALSVSLPGEATRTYVSGWADLERGTPMRPAQVQPVGSGTKPMTAALVVGLVERGRIGLDQRLSRVAASNRRDSGRLRRLTRRFDERLRGVTIRDLLAMTAGLRDYDDSPGFTRAFLRRPRRAFTLHELARFGLQRPRLFPPGARGRTYYSNTNYVLLGMVVRAVTGRSYRSEIERLFRRAGMTSTVYPRSALFPRDVEGPIARGYGAPLQSGGTKLLDRYRRAFSPAPRVRTRVAPAAVRSVSASGAARGPTVGIAPGSARDVRRYGDPTRVLRQNLTRAFSIRGEGASAGAAISNSEDLARFWRALFSGELLGERGLELVRERVPAPPNAPGVRNFYGLGVQGQTVAPDAFWPGSPRLRIWLKLGDIWGYTSASYYVEGPAPYGDVVVTNTTNLFPSPVGDLGVLRETLRALDSDVG